MSDAVDEHLEKAIASLDHIPVRELDATAEAIGSWRTPLHEFASIFRGVAYAREGGWSADIPRFHPRETFPLPTRNSPPRSRMRRPFGGMCATRLAAQKSE